MTEYSFSTEIISDSGAVLSFRLPPPEQHGWVEGELHINWQEENSADPSPISDAATLGKLNAAVALRKQAPEKISSTPKIRLGKGKFLMLFKRVK